MPKKGENVSQPIQKSPTAPGYLTLLPLVRGLARPPPSSAAPEETMHPKRLNKSSNESLGPYNLFGVFGFLNL